MLQINFIAAQVSFLPGDAVAVLAASPRPGMDGTADTSEKNRMFFENERQYLPAGNGSFLHYCSPQ